MQTNPAMAPAQNPFSDIFRVLWIIISKSIHVNPPTAADKFVITIALTALEFMATALPPLKPNQPSDYDTITYLKTLVLKRYLTEILPNHSRAVPKYTSEISADLSFLKFTVLRGPIAKAYLFR